MLQQFNPMCRTAEVLLGGVYLSGYIPGQSVANRACDKFYGGVWQDEPPPIRRAEVPDNSLIAHHQDCSTYNDQDIRKISTTTLRDTAPTGYSTFFLSLPRHVPIRKQEFYE